MAPHPQNDDFAGKRPVKQRDLYYFSNLLTFLVENSVSGAKVDSFSGRFPSKLTSVFRISCNANRLGPVSVLNFRRHLTLDVCVSPRNYWIRF